MLGMTDLNLSSPSINTERQTTCETKSYHLDYNGLLNKNMNNNLSKYSLETLVSKPEQLQQKSIQDFYENYIVQLDNIKNIDTSLMKRTFDEYLESVDADYVKNISSAFCEDYLYNNIEYDDLTLIKKHPDHSDLYYKSLAPEFYIILKVFDILWKNEHSSKKDVVFLSPCRVFLLRSVVKRKFDEELDFQSFN